MHLLAQPSLRSFTAIFALFLMGVHFSSTPATGLQLGTRHSPANALIAEAQLRKRGKCCSKPVESDEDYGDPYPSDPSVDTLSADLVSLGTVTGKGSIFYTGLGGINGQDQVIAWACRDLDSSGAGFVVFRTLIPQEFLEQKLIYVTRKPQSLALWGRRASWASAELAEGNTYLAIPEGTEPLAQSTWTLYEYPALQRNSGIDHVIRVDPDTGETSTVWTQGTDPTDTPEPGPEQRSGPPI